MMKSKKVKALLLLLFTCVCMPIGAVTLHVSVINNTDQVIGESDLQACTCGNRDYIWGKNGLADTSFWKSRFFAPREVKRADIVIGKDICAFNTIKISYVAPFKFSFIFNVVEGANNRLFVQSGYTTTSNYHIEQLSGNLKVPVDVTDYDVVYVINQP